MSIRSQSPVKNQSPADVSHHLLDAIRSFPVDRDVEHCGESMKVSPFEFYADCPRCGTRIKLRALSAAVEIEDVFDAVFDWMNDPRARDAAERRQQALAQDDDP